MLTLNLEGKTIEIISSKLYNVKKILIDGIIFDGRCVEELNVSLSGGINKNLILTCPEYKNCTIQKCDCCGAYCLLRNFEVHDCEKYKAMIKEIYCEDGVKLCK